MPHETLSRKAGGLSPIGALVREHDRDRFQTALFAPAGDREALFALYAFNYEIARVRESVREPMLGQIRLQWWREAGGRIGVEIALARVDQPVERITAQPAPADHLGNRLGDVVPPRLAAGKRRLNRLAPPLQADLPEHRLAHALAHAGDLIVEGVKREQRLAVPGRREQRGLEAVPVVLAHKRADRR